MMSPETEILAIPQLIEEVATGRLRILDRAPQRRPTAVRTREILEDILAGLPIGAIAVWRTDTEFPWRRTLGRIGIPSRAPRGYIIDGRLRIETLVRALWPESINDDEREHWVAYDPVQRTVITPPQPGTIGFQTMLWTKDFMEAMAEAGARQEDVDTVPTTLRNYLVPITVVHCPSPLTADRARRNA